MGPTTQCPRHLLEINQIELLLQTARDEALPCFWRNVCIEQTALQVACLVSQLKLHDHPPLGGVLAAVQQARDALP